MHVVKSFTTSVKGREIPPVIHLKQLDEHTYVEHEQETNRERTGVFCRLHIHSPVLYFQFLFVVLFFVFYL